MLGAVRVCVTVAVELKIAMDVPLSIFIIVRTSELC